MTRQLHPLTKIVAVSALASILGSSIVVATQQTKPKPLPTPPEHTSNISATKSAIVVPSAAQFQRADSAAKRQTLKRLAERTLTVTTTQLTSILTVGLQDVDPGIRSDVAELVAMKASAARFSATPEALAAWASDRPALTPVQATLFALITSDSDEHVRLSAILASINLQFDGDRKKTIRLDRTLSLVLANAYTHEQATGVRTEIIKTFALTDADPELRAASLTAALNDVAPSVVQYALFGVGKSKLFSAAPAAVRLLSDENKNVRLAAAQTVAAFGPAARQYIPYLQRALAIEQDSIVRKTIEGTIRSIER